MTEEGKETPAESKSGAFGSEERNRVYSNHTATMNDMDSSEPSLLELAAEDAPTEAPPAEEATDASPEVKADEGFEPEQAPSGEEEKKEEDKGKTVPLDALHAEREKRKGFQGEVTELKEQVQTLLADINGRNKQDSEMGEAFEGSDAEIAKLRREIGELKDKDSKRDATTEADRVAEVKRKTASDVADVDKSLAKEGYPGFIFAKGMVADEIHKEIATNPDNDWMLHSHDAWKDIFKKRVFPKMQKAFTSKERAEKNAEKEELKDKAALASSAGKSDSPAPKKKEEEHTYSDYLKMRKDSAPS